MRRYRRLMRRHRRSVSVDIGDCGVGVTNHGDMGTFSKPDPSHEKWQKACINICKHILKFSNYVLVRVPINTNDYE